MDEKDILFPLLNPKKMFLDFQPEFEEAKAVVLPVPYDGTASYIKGTRNGPAAIIEASPQLEAHDIELGLNIYEKVPAYTLDELKVEGKKPEDVVKLVSEAVESIVKHGKKPVVFGGEHSITAGAVAGLNSPVSVLQIDAHPDLRDSYEGSKYNHACEMRRVREIADNAVQVGIRTMCDEELDYIKEKGIEKSIFYARKLDDNRKDTHLNENDIKSMVSQLNDNVYVTIDVDGFDPSVMPGTGTPQPGGLSWYDVVSIMEAVAKEKNVVGFDIVELMPIPPLPTSEFTAAKLAYKMMGYFWR